MQTTINQVTPVEYEMEVTATSDELAPELEKALRAQQANTDRKGFRPGKVPLSMVKKMYGKALGYKVAEQAVQDTFEEEMADSDLDMIGRPTLTQLDYELDEDLHAVIKFGVRPEVELKDLSEAKVDALAYEVTDEDIEEEIEQFLQQHADLVPRDDSPIEETDYVTIDLQRIDEDSGTPIIGEKEEDVSFFMDDDRLKSELHDALLGKKVEDSIRVDLPHEGDDDEAGLVDLPGEQKAVHTHHYEVTIKDAKQRELPELDDAFVSEVSDGELESAEELREEVRSQIKHSWEHQAQEFLQGNIVERMLELHPVPVPASLVELNLDAMVENVKEGNDGELPDDFDEAAFRQANRERAEKQGRWMLIRDRFIEQEGIEVEDEDLDDFFEQQSEAAPATPEQIRQMYDSNPNIRNQIDQRLLGEKVFEALKDRFEIVEKDSETIEQEFEERQQRQAEGASGGVLQ